VPLGFASDGANRHDSKLLDPTLRADREQVGGLESGDWERPHQRGFLAVLSDADIRSFPL